jgi:antitoxin (DNA-binding transcriptional repressor) of toxin-antitoxin stability system
MAATVGVRDLKNSLSRWLRLVRGGESVIVLDHGRPIAVISAAGGTRAPRSTAEHLASLAARGIVTLAVPRRSRRPRRLPRVNLSRAVAEDREDRV